jgi:hypothetical protein
MKSLSPDQSKPRDRPRAGWLDYAGAAFALAVATLLRLAVGPVLVNSFPSVTYLS